MRRRRGATLIELALGIGLAVSVLVLVSEAFQFFTSRSASTTEEIMRARALGFFSDRLRRLLRFAVKVVPDGEGFVIVHLVLGEGGVSSLGESLVGLGGEPGGPRWLEITPAGQSEAIRYEVGLKDLRLELKEEDGRVGVVVAQGEGLDPFPTRVRPLLPGQGKLVLSEGEALDMEALRREYAEGDWAPSAELATTEAGRAETSGATERYQDRAGIVPQPSGPTRNSLGLEANVFGVELSPLGRIFLPLTLEGGVDRLNAAEVTRVLEEMGYPVYDATLLAVFLAGAELPDRALRAASLGLFMSKLDGRSGAEQADLIAAAHPAWAARANAEDEASARGGDWFMVFPGDLLRAAGLGDEVVGAALDGAGDLPVRFGDLFDDPSEGGEPGWDVWQTAVGDGGQLPPEVEANLPPDVRERLRPDAGGDGQGGAGGTGGAADVGGTGGTDATTVGGGAVVPGIGPGTIDIAVAVGPDYPDSIADADVAGGALAEAIAAAQELVQAAPDLSQASETFDTARNDQAIRQAEVDQAQSDFNVKLTEWLTVNHEYDQARLDMISCQSCGDPAGCSCGGEAAEFARLEEEIAVVSEELNALEVALGEAQIAQEIAESNLSNAALHYENISKIMEARYGY